jgi:hypothetical protein
MSPILTGPTLFHWTNILTRYFTQTWRNNLSAFSPTTSHAPEMRVHLFFPDIGLQKCATLSILIIGTSTLIIGTSGNCRTIALQLSKVQTVHEISYLQFIRKAQDPICPPCLLLFFFFSGRNHLLSSRLPSYRFAGKRLRIEQGRKKGRRKAQSEPRWLHRTDRGREG